MNSEEDAIANFQKEKSYQVELVKLKQEEDANRLKREYEHKLEDLHRELRNRDYHNRELNEKSSYLELKINELNKGIEVLQAEHLRFRDGNAGAKEQLSRQQFSKTRLLDITEELERQKSEMEAEIHVLLDIEAEKSRSLNSMECQLRNSQTTERSLHEKLSALTDNFGSLEEHIATMKEWLISIDCHNEHLEKGLQAAEQQLAER